MRNAEISRKTKETDIELALSLDGTGAYKIDTGCGFLNHMLELFARHARFSRKNDSNQFRHRGYKPFSLLSIFVLRARNLLD